MLSSDEVVHTLVVPVDRHQKVLLSSRNGCFVPHHEPTPTPLLSGGLRGCVQIGPSLVVLAHYRPH